MLLWAVGVLFVFSFAAGPVVLFMTGRERARERKWPAATGYFMGASVAGFAWLAAVGYCVYRAYLAAP